MATLNHRLFLISVLIFVFIEFANCLQCFSCSSAREDICDDVFSHHAFHTVPTMLCESSPPIPIPGAGPNIYCGKAKNIHSSSASNDYIFRGCVPENYCRLINAKTSDCEVCDQDNCNLAVKSAPSIITGVATVFLLLKFIYFY